MAIWNAIILDYQDDAKQAGTTMTLTDSPLTFTAGTQWWGFRFINCPIPVGSTINSTLLTLYVTSTTYDDPGGLIIYGQLSADVAGYFTINAADITNRLRTTDNVVWSGTNIGAGDRNPPDLSTVLDEIINEGAYQLGYPIVFLFDAVGTTDFRVRSYDGFTDTCARLTVDYTPPAGAGGAAGPLVNGPRLRSKLRGLV